MEGLPLNIVQEALRAAQGNKRFLIMDKYQFVLVLNRWSM